MAKKKEWKEGEIALAFKLQNSIIINSYEKY